MYVYHTSTKYLLKEVEYTIYPIKLDETGFSIFYSLTTSALQKY